MFERMYLLGVKHIVLYGDMDTHESYEYYCSYQRSLSRERTIVVLVND